MFLAFSSFGHFVSQANRGKPGIQMIETGRTRYINVRTRGEPGIQMIETGANPVYK